MKCRSYNKATEHFSTILSLNPMNRMDVLIKRSKARTLMGSLEEALSDADEVYSVLHGASDSGIDRARRSLKSTNHVIKVTR